MTSENFEFSDVSDQKYSSETKLTMEGRKGGYGGCFISAKIGAVLVFLGVGLAIAVGVIVFFAADGRDIVCQCNTASERSRCVGMAAMGDQELCGQCPAPSAPAHTTPSEMTTAVPTKASRVTDVRLPTSVVPVHYNISLQPYMYGGDSKLFTFKGSVTIRVKCVQPTNNVTLHVKDLNIDKTAINFTGVQVSGSDPKIQNVADDLEREFLILHLDKDMEADSEYLVEISYWAPLKATLKGLYLSKYERQNKTVYLASTQFQPTDARRAFPCFDEPAIKATFTVTLVRKSDLISISNTRVQATSTSWSEDGVDYVSDLYEPTPKMSTYLLAFVICDFAYTTANTSTNVTYRAFSRPAVKNSTLYALDVGVKVLPYFEKYFNTTYPLPKQDMIAIPDFAAGAMENWGLITYRETAMLYDQDISNQASKERVAIVVSHELAHQWFGDLVTLAWWDDLWLNEGFATFGEYMGVDIVEPEWKMFEKFVISDLQKVFDDDGLLTSHPIYVPVYHPEEINEIFDSISYSKGASVIRMMRHFLGFETFQKGVVRYLQSKKFDSAVHNDLWQSLEDQARQEGKDIHVKEIMDTWTLQMNYPVVTVTRDFNDLGAVHVSQKRFLSDPTAKDPEKFKSPFGYKWSIPITLTSSVNPQFIQNDSTVHWLFKDQTSVQLNIGEASLPGKDDADGWILANTEQNGYYRVNYQVGNWENLIKQLGRNHTVISTINRAQIINDAWNLAKPGWLDMKIALDTLNYLNKEHSPLPWKAARKELSYVEDMISLTATSGHFQQFMREKVSDPFQFYGLDNSGAGHIETEARAVIASLACGYGIESCTTEAKRQFQAWMNDTTRNKVDPNLKRTVYCTGISHGGWKEWQFVWKMLQLTEVPSEKSLLRLALTCSRKPWILNHYLKQVLEPSSPIRSQDALPLIGNIASSSIGRPLAWRFYRANFDRLSSDFSESFFSWSQIIKDIAMSFNTEFELAELKSFMEAKKDKLGTAKRAFEQAMERVNTNIKWMSERYPIVDTWFSTLYAS